ncbi:MAG: hypothetical protein MJ087_05940 [Lachnospiraceae bacterium]|nr:hypothetical protein [Lachnospiraceae bacterium]
MRFINHRGYNVEAPENTLSAFRLSKEHGFDTIECDVTLSREGIPMIMHDATLERTSNGQGFAYEKTYEELRQLDFGSWYSEDFKGEKMPSFKEFCELCDKMGYKAYVEIKNDTPMEQANVDEIIRIAKEYGLLSKITWISFKEEYLVYVRNRLPKARLGYLAKPSADVFHRLKTENNEVFFDTNYKKLKPKTIEMAKECGAAIEVWTVNTEEALENLDPYVSGVTSNWMSK